MRGLLAPRPTLAARVNLLLAAESLRQRRMTEAEAEPSEANEPSEPSEPSERMVLPVVLLGMGFLLLLGYPAVSRVLGGTRGPNISFPLARFHRFS